MANEKTVSDKSNFHLLVLLVHYITLQVGLVWDYACHTHLTQKVGSGIPNICKQFILVTCCIKMLWPRTLCLWKQDRIIE